MRAIPKYIALQLHDKKTSTPNTISIM